jgi:hypothetical protein
MLFSVAYVLPYAYGGAASVVNVHDFAEDIGNPSDLSSTVKENGV